MELKIISRTKDKSQVMIRGQYCCIQSNMYNKLYHRTKRLVRDNTTKGPLHSNQLYEYTC